MIQPPDRPETDLSAYADWVEVCAVASPSRGVSRADVVDTLQDGGSLGHPGARRIVGHGEFALEGMDEAEAEVDGLANELWRCLSSRRISLENLYPFIVSRDRLDLKAEAWSAQTCYVAMLLISATAYYEAQFTLERVQGIHFRVLFEQIVEKSKAEHMGGATTRFGWPPFPGPAAGIRQRIQSLGAVLGLEVENLAGKVRATDRDRTLDVVSRLRFHDDGAGSLVLLTQCATGRNWEDKLGEPNLAKWNDIFHWQATLVRGVAVPWLFDDMNEFGRRWRHFGGAVILDRSRLMAGDPDNHIEADLRRRIVQWVEGQLGALPMLTVNLQTQDDGEAPGGRGARHAPRRRSRLPQRR